jgi:hypothetical protein
MLRPILNSIFECNLQQHWRHRMGNFSSAFKKADSQWEQILKCRLEILQKTGTSITYFSNMFSP